MLVSVVVPKKADCCFEHGDFHVLPLAVAFSGEERRGNGLGDGDRGELVAKQLADGFGFSDLRVTLDIRDPRVRLDDIVVDPLLRVGTLGAEAADGDVNESRIQREESLRPNAQALRDSGPPVLDEDIGLGRHLLQQIDARFLAQVQGDGPLASVCHVKVRRHPAPGAAHVAQNVALARYLDLDHVGALVGEHANGQGAGNHR